MYVRRNIDIVRYIKIYAPYIHILKSLFIIHISKKIILVNSFQIPMFNKTLIFAV